LKYRIIGDAVQAVAVELSEGDTIFSRLGTLLFVKGAVKSNTSPDGAYWNTIIDTIVKDGESPIVLYKCVSGGGLVGFKAPAPGKIHPVTISPDQRVTVRRKSIIAASEGVQFDHLHLEGEDDGTVEPDIFVVVTGTGYIFLHGAGNLVDFTLAAGEKMAVDGEMVLVLEGDIDPNPKAVGAPGQDGAYPYILLMHLVGPGRVVLYTMPMTI